MYLDQFVYLGFFENEKKYMVSCTFRCSTLVSKQEVGWLIAGGSRSGTAGVHHQVHPPEEAEAEGWEQQRNWKGSRRRRRRKLLEQEDDELGGAGGYTTWDIHHNYTLGAELHSEQNYTLGSRTTL